MVSWSGRGDAIDGRGLVKVAIAIGGFAITSWTAGGLGAGTVGVFVGE